MVPVVMTTVVMANIVSASVVIVAKLKGCRLSPRCGPLVKHLHGNRHFGIVSAGTSRQYCVVVGDRPTEGGDISFI